MTHGSKLYVVSSGPNEARAHPFSSNGNCNCCVQVLTTLILQLVGKETRLEYQAPLTTTTVRDVKSFLQKQGLCGDKQKMFFSGRVLDDR